MNRQPAILHSEQGLAEVPEGLLVVGVVLKYWAY